jgi:hypothetical protein
MELFGRKKKKAEEEYKQGINDLQQGIEASRGTGQKISEDEEIGTGAQRLRSLMEEEKYESSPLGIKAKQIMKDQDRVDRLNKEIEELDSERDLYRENPEEYGKVSKKIERKVAIRNLAVRKNLPPITNTELKHLDLEKDQNGKIVLYHITSAENYSNVQKDRALKPAAETSSRSWRSKNERANSKNKQIYLCSKDKVDTLKQMIPGGSIVLKTHVDEKRLMPDEDSSTDNWKDSLNIGKTCSYRGNIKDFEQTEL